MFVSVAVRAWKGKGFTANRGVKGACSLVGERGQRHASKPTDSFQREGDLDRGWFVGVCGWGWPRGGAVLGCEVVGLTGEIASANLARL